MSAAGLAGQTYILNPNVIDEGSAGDAERAVYSNIQSAILSVHV